MSLYAIDGTWNSIKTGELDEKNTNVIKFCQRYEAGTFYEKGVGTKLGFLGKWFGGAFGIGGDSRVDRLYRNICIEYVHGDTDIDIIGFSRGAALALDLANKLHRSGIRDADDRQVVKEPTIRFLGLWDTVGAFGLTLGPFHRINLGHHLRLPASVTYCFHALALDERRSNFAPTRLGPQAYEVWFRGNHSDVGGGNGNTGLNNISLRWMLMKAALVGLPVAQARIPTEDECDADAALNEPLDPIKTRLRKVAADDCVHFTVRPRPGERFNVPSESCGIEQTDDEATRRVLDRP